jgi:hypothetical protein
MPVQMGSLQYKHVRHIKSNTSSNGGLDENVLSLMW